MRWLPVVVLVGCAAPESAVPSHGSAATGSAAAVPSDAAAAAVAPSDAAAPQAWTISTSSVLAAAPITGSVVTANHGAPITTIAVSEDGSVAATADGHSVRVWPSLDGKHEPVVVAMRTPLALAVARDGDAIVTAGLDAIGQLELVRTSAEGAPVARLDVASSGPIRAIWATGIGMFALRDDGGIALYELSGALRGELPLSPRQRVRTLAVRDDRALAIVEDEGKVHGQWVEVDAHALHWGERTPQLRAIRRDAASPDVVLSPDHRRIGIAEGTTVVMVDVSTGKMLRRFDDEERFGKMHVDGFVDSSDLAFDKNGLLGELSTEDDVPDWRENQLAGSVFAVGDRVVVGADVALLMVAPKGEATQFLGYQMIGPVSIVPLGNGFLANNYSMLVDLGPDLRARRSIELGTHSGLLQNPLFVDGDHVVTAFAYGYENPQGVFFADVKTGTVSPLGDGYAMYNAETGLLILSRNRVLAIRRYDRKKHEFGEELTFDVAPSTQIAWLAPARGDFAVVTVNSETDVKIDIVRVRDKPEIIKSKTLNPGEDWFATQDITALLEDPWKPSTRRFSPDRALVAEVRDHRLTLRDAAGAERWMVSAAGIDDVTWTARGELVAFGSGIARVDLATGALRERQCGWRFGLWPERPTPFFGVNSSSTLCEAP